jgi:chaperonin GroEL
MGTRNKEWQVPKVVFQPQVSLGMQRGINQVVDAIRPTLGPSAPAVAVESTIRRDKPPELLDDGGLIARRIIQLAGRDEDVGAMFIRHLLWQVRQKAGDGTATAAVIFQEAYNRGLRFVAAGGNAQRLRAHLERGTREALQELDRMTVPIQGQDRLAGLAETLCGDSELSCLLGEIYAAIGEFGRLEIRAGSKTTLECEYYPGMYWDGGLLSRLMLADPHRLPVRLETAAVVISDLEVEEARETVHLLSLAAGLGARSVLLVAQKVSDRAMAVLLEKTNREAVGVTVVKTPGQTGSRQWAALQDLSILTGAQPLVRAAGTNLTSLTPDQVGWARQAWADADHFGLSGGGGDPAAVSQHLQRLQAACLRLEGGQGWNELRERIGQMAGRSATLWVGAASPLDLERRKAVAEHTATAMQGAMRKGVVPGGGAAFWASGDRLRVRLAASPADASGDAEKYAAYRILIAALQAPLRTLLANAGCGGGDILAQIEQAGAGYGYDLRQGRVVDMVQAGIVDSAAVAKAALYAAVCSAALALTTDVVVHRRNPPEAIAAP